MYDICFVAPNESDSAGGISRWFSIVKNNLGDSYNCYCVDTSLKRKSGHHRSLFNRYIYSFLRIRKQKSKLRQFIENGCSILHVATSGGLGFYRDYVLLKLAKRNNVKTVLHLHFGRIPQLLKSKSLERILFKKCVKFVDTLISIDKQTFYSLKSIGIANVYVPNPAYVYENKYDLNSKRIIFVGHVIREKGVNELIDAFTKIRSDSNKDWSLQIVGPYQYKYINQLQKRYNFDHITFVGQVSGTDAIEMISKSSFLVLPSYTEGMPNVVLEAMSCGVPCIATNVGNIPEMIRECGILINPKDTLELREAMTSMMSNSALRDSLSKKSYKRVRDNYSIEKVMKLLQTIWETPINRL